MTNDELFNKVRDLKLPVGQYAIFGSGPMGVRGLKTCHDIDIIVTEDLWNTYKAKGWEVRNMSHGSRYLFNDEIELWKDWKPGEWDIHKLIKEAEIINGLPFVKLEKVLQWKKLSGREKDLKDIETIQKFFGRYGNTQT